jgi:putative phosphoesterase
MLVGIISDTHGLLRPEAIAALRPTKLIIHAGDIGSPDILEKLRELAPLFAVRGNVDRQAWADNLPESQTVPVGAHKFHVVHAIAELAIDPVKAGIAAVIFGHSHEPSIERRAGVLYLNPGSAGPRRFKLPVCLARVQVTDMRLAPSIVSLLA